MHLFDACMSLMYSRENGHHKNCQVMPDIACALCKVVRGRPNSGIRCRSKGGLALSMLFELSCGGFEPSGAALGN